MPNVSRSSSGRPAHAPLLVSVAELRRRVGNVDEVEGAVALDGAEVLGTRLADGAEATVALRLEALSDAVVITEIDFSQWDENVRRRLFVGLTRARLRVALVASDEVAQLIEDRLG